MYRTRERERSENGLCSRAEQGVMRQWLWLCALGCMSACVPARANICRQCRPRAFLRCPLFYLFILLLSCHHDIIKSNILRSPILINDIKLDARHWLAKWLDTTIEENGGEGQTTGYKTSIWWAINQYSTWTAVNKIQDKRGSRQFFMANLKFWLSS